MGEGAPAAGNAWRALVKIAALVALIVTANLLAETVTDSLRLDIRPSNEDMVHRAITLSAGAYVILIAIPFVPGVEIGLTLIAMLGPPIVFLVYVSTLAGLSLSFFAGRAMSLDGLSQLLADLRLRRAAALLSTVANLDGPERLAFLGAKAPNRLVPLLLRHRYIALAVIINTPGNIIIGGGGGISLIAGASRLYSIPGFLITIAIAVSPLPLAILLFGPSILPG